MWQDAKAKHQRQVLCSTVKHNTLTCRQVDQANALASEVCVPKNYKDALSCPQSHEWVDSMKREYKNFTDMGVWEEVPNPGDKKLHSFMVAHAVKSDEHGNETSKKTRMCLRGFNQIHGVDFDDTCAPVVRTSIVRFTLSIITQLNLHAKQFDFRAAFLNSFLKHLTYARPPPGYKVAKEGNVLKTLKAVCGTKQAANHWYEDAHKLFSKLGFRQSRIDQCLHIKYVDNKDIVLINLHVDDGICAAKDPKLVDATLKRIASKCEISQSPLKWYIGLKTSRTPHEMHISSEKHVFALARKFKLEDAKAVRTPIEPKLILRKDDGSPKCSEDQRSECVAMVGALMYITTMCRPDAAYAVSKLSSFMQCPTHVHLKQARRCIIHLYHTRDHGLLYKRNIYLKGNDKQVIQNVEINGWHDSDYNQCPDTRRSQTGFLTYVKGNPLRATHRT